MFNEAAQIQIVRYGEMIRALRESHMLAVALLLEAEFRAYVESLQV